MRFASFTADGRAGWGAIIDDQVLDLTDATPHPSLRTAIAASIAGETVAGAGGIARPLSSVTLLPPIPDASKILCVGLNYADHIAEMDRATPEKPTVFTRFNDTLVGDGEALIAPRNSTTFDFEGEFAVVIGRGGRHISEDDAHAHVFGYTLMNDGSLRDYQRHTTQFTPGKNFPRSGGLGPWVVTADEFGAVADQVITTRLNDVVVQSSTLDQLVFGVPALISYISEWTELVPGDIIATGTPGGVGDGRTPPLYLFPGDVVTVEVAGLGILTNPVAEEL
ncbi:fumarylacetoacetate hydrolase family protein [Microbacterium sp. RD1]|uniref:fumarylacetoacetate hydrolase family protein n=1 Tax=Microbacterium sp. RD1 TaxID=3457313 RepID=UPI003FA561C0